MTVNPDSALQTEHDGEIHYFCSEECRQQFLSAPAVTHRADMVETAWKVADPILRTWAGHPHENLPFYAPGTWGPPEAEQHHRWQSR